LSVSRRADRAAAFAFVKEIFFTDDLCFRMMSDKDDFYMLIFVTQKTRHPKKETASNILFELAHRTRCIHHRDYSGVGTGLYFFIPCFKSQIIRSDTMDARLAR